jgi:hypothetical protein
MSRSRHKRAKGGKVHWNAGEEQPAAKEAEERKHGGHVHGEGEHAKHRVDRRARGGGVHGEEPHHAVKEKSMHHKHGMHVPGRKRGGGVGSDRTPLTSAANVKHIIPGEQEEHGVRSD